MVAKRKSGREKESRPVRVTRAGRILKRLLERSNTGITDFAKRAGVERVTVHRVITGHRWENISVDFAVRCCDAVGPGLDVRDFMSITALPVGEAGEDDDPDKRRKR